jgi:stearoyl-CoA desaturase (Delta-9 desaturase)
LPALSEVIVSVATAPTPQPKIRGVEPTPARVTYWQRVAMVLIVVLPLAGVVAGLWWGYGRGVSGVDIGLLLGFYVITGLGITVGYHRLLTHKSFRAPGWVRAGFAVAGSLAIQGAVIDWVATHRRHHAYADAFGDPHSPHVEAGDGVLGMLRGLWHAHVGWMFRGETTLQEAWAPDLLDEPAIRAISRNFGWFVLASFALPALLGGLLTMSWAGALTGVIWGGLMRIFLLHHVTWSINSICHVFGTRPFESHDESRNNLPMALLGFGEGWHNAHHAFPASARHGLRWWEFDVSYLVIRTLRVLGLAKDVKLPSATQLARRSRARAGG